MTKTNNQTEILLKVIDVNPIEYKGTFVTGSNKKVEIVIISNKHPNKKPKKYRGNIELLTRTENRIQGIISHRIFNFEDLRKSKTHLESAFTGIKIKYESMEEYQKRIDSGMKKNNKKAIEPEKQKEIKELKEKEKIKKLIEPDWKKMNKKEICAWLTENRVKFKPDEKKAPLAKLAKQTFKENAKKNKRK